MANPPHSSWRRWLGEIESRSAEADPDEIFQSFLAVLNEGALERHENIRSKKCPPDDYIIYGGRAFIEALIEGGLKVIILSGNPHDQVNEESRFTGHLTLL